MTAIALLEGPPGEETPPDATVYRALRDDARFGFVVVRPGDGYEVAYEDGQPDAEGGAVLINPFAVPEEDDERFLAGWHAAREALSAHHGYLGTRLHRSTGPAEFRYVNIARWSSPLMFSRAVQDAAFQQAAGAMGYEAHPALYTVA